MRVIVNDDGMEVIENTLTGETWELSCRACFMNTSEEPRKKVRCSLVRNMKPLNSCSECFPLGYASERLLKIRENEMNLARKNEGELINCIYRFVSFDNEIIYIGKAKNLKNRLQSHKHLPNECYSEIWKIEYCEFDTEYDMDFAERYFIPKVTPKYNTVLSDRNIGISVDALDKKMWHEFK